MSTQQQPQTHIWGATCDMCGSRFTPLKPSHKRCPSCYRLHPLPQKQGGVFRTITSKYAGTCKRCGGTFEAGEQIRYGGKGLTYHLSDKCDEQQHSQPEPQPEPEWRTQCVLCEFWGTDQEHKAHYAFEHAEQDTCYLCGRAVENCECE